MIQDKYAGNDEFFFILQTFCEKVLRKRGIFSSVLLVKRGINSFHILIHVRLIIGMSFLIVRKCVLLRKLITE